jgi:ubiquinone/menaquinone biosynthesis C-methylase UbiE
VFEEKKRICPVRLAGSLDNRVRKWLQNPRKILGSYVKSGMTVVDFGCGPGFFTVELAELVGESGRVIAVDVQEGMLRKLKEKVMGTELESRIKLHKCDENRIGISEHADVVVAFYVFHELPNQIDILDELKNILKDRGIMILVEPKYIHVSNHDFEQTVNNAVGMGFEKLGYLKIFLSRAVVLRKG